MNFSVGIVHFNYGTFGGAEKRYSLLYRYLFEKNDGNIYYFINYHFYQQLKDILPDLPFTNVRIIDLKRNIRVNKKIIDHDTRQSRISVSQDDNKAQIFRKIYWYYKNLLRNYRLFKQLDIYRKKYNIKVFLGIFSGILPLVFYLKHRPRKAAIIFSDMDSWFSNVYPDMNKNWYKKYYSFNYALENSDVIDFLSPFIYQGVAERGLKIDLNNVSICPCSFIDYSNCKSGNKEDFEIAFASRLEPDKNPLLFLRGAQSILNKYTNVKFHLLGEGSLTDEVQNFISANKLSSKINFQYHKNPPEIFAETSVFVSIQTTNNYPSQSVLEAMACSNAIIASDVGDTKMFVNEKNGILINLNLDSLVSALEYLIRNPAKTKELGDNAKKFVKLNHNIEKTENYYNELFQKAYDKVFM